MKVLCHQSVSCDFSLTSRLTSLFLKEILKIRDRLRNNFSVILESSKCFHLHRKLTWQLINSLTHSEERDVALW